MTECRAGWCENTPPERYEYCDMHHLLRDRTDDGPGDQASLSGGSA